MKALETSQPKEYSLKSENRVLALHSQDSIFKNFANEMAFTQKTWNFDSSIQRIGLLRVIYKNRKCLSAQLLFHKKLVP